MGTNIVFVTTNADKIHVNTFPNNGWLVEGTEPYMALYANPYKDSHMGGSRLPSSLSLWRNLHI